MVLFYLPSVLSTLVPLFLMLVMYLEAVFLPVLAAVVWLPWSTAGWPYLLEALTAWTAVSPW